MDDGLPIEKLIPSLITVFNTKAVPKVSFQGQDQIINKIMAFKAPTFIKVITSDVYLIFETQANLTCMMA